MSVPADILCIGSVLWDIIGRSPLHMQKGDDKPGHICRQPGGVALNIALTLRKMGVMPALLSVTGQDAESARGICFKGHGWLPLGHALRSKG